MFVGGLIYLRFIGLWIIYIFWHFHFASERLKQDATVLLDNDGDDIPIIPELDDVTEDDLATQVAAPPRYTIPKDEIKTVSITWKFSGTVNK